MAKPERVALAALVEPLGRELADRLEHHEALAAAAEQALVDERLEQVEVGVADRLGGLRRHAAREDGEPAEQLLLLGVEQLLAPRDRRVERALALGQSREREESSGSRWSSRSSSAAGSSTRTRAAASSIASGSRSTRSQIAAASS